MGGVQASKVSIPRYLGSPALERVLVCCTSQSTAGSRVCFQRNWLEVISQAINDLPYTGIDIQILKHLAGDEVLCH